MIYKYSCFSLNTFISCINVFFYPTGIPVSESIITISDKINDLIKRHILNDHPKLRSKNIYELVSFVVTSLSKSYRKKIPGLKYAECQVVQDMSYNTVYDLNRPHTGYVHLDAIIDTVSYKEETDTSIYTDIHMLIDRYLDLDIQKFTGMTLEEYLDLTTWTSSIIDEWCRGKIQAINLENEEMEDILKRKQHQFGSIKTMPKLL